MTSELHFGPEHARTSAKRRVSILQGMRFGQLSIPDVYECIVTIPTSARILVDVRMQYDVRSGVVTKIQQGRGRTWSDLGVNRKQSSAIRVRIARACEKVVAAKRAGQHDLFA